MINDQRKRTLTKEKKINSKILIILISTKFTTFTLKPHHRNFMKHQIIIMTIITIFKLYIHS